MDQAMIAVNRFGLGKRPDEAWPSDPRAWLRGQLARFAAQPPGAERLATRAAIVGEIADYRDMAQDQRGGLGKDDAGKAKVARKTPELQMARKEAFSLSREQHVAQVGVRVRSAVASDTPLAERLVHFWANHFAVSADKAVVIGLAGLLEFEAIRPNIGGTFLDLLLAVERHPAMLLFLDQAQSVGPNSPLGQRAGQRGRMIGLNENLGREILELHTLGVRTGYSQADVTEFARALTGWTVAGLGRGTGRLLEMGAEPGSFHFVPALHEPGARTVLDKRYGEGGGDQARAVLADLARHPATARHIATKLARHFVADDPPPALVARLERAFLDSGGHLPTLYAALIDAPETWGAAPAKFRTPWQWGIAALRAVTPPGVAPLANSPDRMITGLFQELGQPTWRPGSPAGFDDVAASWAAPDALYRRVEAAGRIGARAGGQFDARRGAEQIFAGALSPATRESIARAESPQQGLALLLVAPEMMRC